MAPPLLKCQKSTLLNNLSQSKHATSGHVLLLSKCSGDNNAPQPYANADQNVLQPQQMTRELAKRFLEALVCMITPWSI
jgi:hypothetical protein